MIGHERMLTTRPATDVADLRRAGDVLTRAWSAGSPRVSATRGDLAWWFCQAWPAGIEARLRLWDLGGEPVAWSWHDGASLDYQVWTGTPELDERVEQAIIDLAIDDAGERSRTGGDGAVEAWTAEDDASSLRHLADRGFIRLDAASAHAAGTHVRLSQFQRAVAAGDLPEPELPPGYRIRSVAGEEELAARVEVHRRAFAPSRMRIEKYRRLVELDDYRFEDDLVVEAPDGSLAAFAMAWWDPVALVGEFEPVGTEPDHQRRGLGRALLLHGLRRYRELGARLAQVFSDADNVASEALYESVGFRRRAFHVRLRRAADAAAPAD